jgi:hypothetical protein
MAARAQRLTQARVVLIVAMPTAVPPTVGAAGTLPVRVARQHKAALGLSRVDAAKLGAVKVTNNRGCSLIVSGMPLPPLSPAARSW